MNSQPEVVLAIEPAHLPHYTHSAVIVGSVIIVAIITLVAGVTLAIAHHLVSAGPTTHRDQSLQLHRIEKHEMIGAYLKLTEHTARSDLTGRCYSGAGLRRGKRMGQGNTRPDRNDWPAIVVEAALPAMTLRARRTRGS
jgi:hypothetical protein